MVADPVAVALQVAEALERCGLRYLVGGSLASSFSGEPRSTLDVDMVVELDERTIDLLVHELGPEFYADPESLRRAVRKKSTANLIHFETSTKVDVFVVGGSELDLVQMDRRQKIVVTRDPERHLYVYTPEDILLQKLRWYRMGGETSDRQWRDVLGIIVVQDTRLDEVYLTSGAETLGVRDLLECALEEARGH